MKLKPDPIKKEKVFAENHHSSNQASLLPPAASRVYTEERVWMLLFWASAPIHKLLSCPVLNLFSFNIGTETGGEDAIKANLQYLNGSALVLEPTLPYF